MFKAWNQSQEPAESFLKCRRQKIDEYVQRNKPLKFRVEIVETNQELGKFVIHLLFWESPSGAMTRLIAGKI